MAQELTVKVKLWLIQSSFCSLWQATGQRQMNNLDLRINHIVQDSQVFPQPVINHPISARHCADWLVIGTDRVTGDYTENRDEVRPLSIQVLSIYIKNSEAVNTCM